MSDGKVCHQDQRMLGRKRTRRYSPCTSESQEKENSGERLSSTEAIICNTAKVRAQNSWSFVFRLCHVSAEKLRLHMAESLMKAWMHPLRLRSRTLPPPNYQSSASLKRRFGKDTCCSNARVSSLNENERNIKGTTQSITAGRTCSIRDHS